MMTTTLDREKILLLDTFLSNLSAERLKEIAEQEIVMSKLAGQETSYGLISQIIMDLEFTRTEVARLVAESHALKQDLVTLIKCLNSSIYGYNQDFQMLKQKHNIY